jgi:hypothetical protein
MKKKIFYLFFINKKKMDEYFFDKESTNKFVEQLKFTASFFERDIIDTEINLNFQLITLQEIIEYYGSFDDAFDYLNSIKICNKDYLNDYYEDSLLSSSRFTRRIYSPTELDFVLIYNYYNPLNPSNRYRFQDIPQDKICGFLMAQKNECNDPSEKDYYSVRLICNKPATECKKYGTILIGCYLFILAYKFNKYRQKYGLLELAENYKNMAGYCTYTKLGFEENETIKCDAFSNLKMTCPIDQYVQTNGSGLYTELIFKILKLDDDDNKRVLCKKPSPLSNENKILEILQKFWIEDKSRFTKLFVEENIQYYENLIYQNSEYINALPSRQDENSNSNWLYDLFSNYALDYTNIVIFDVLEDDEEVYSKYLRKCLSLPKGQGIKIYFSNKIINDSSISILNQFLKESKITNAVFVGDKQIYEIKDNFVNDINTLEKVSFYGFDNVLRVGKEWLSYCDNLNEIEIHDFRNLKTIGSIFLSYSMSIFESLIFDGGELLENIENITTKMFVKDLQLGEKRYFNLRKYIINEQETGTSKGESIRGKGKGKMSKFLNKFSTSPSPPESIPIRTKFRPDLVQRKVLPSKKLPLPINDESSSDDDDDSDEPFGEREPKRLKSSYGKYSDGRRKKKNIRKIKKSNRKPKKSKRKSKKIKKIVKKSIKRCR